jgi:type I restriction enzyme R subunit
VDSVSPKARLDEQWLAFIAQRKIEELERIIAEENLHPEAARRFMDDAFRDGGIASTGTAITQVLPPTSRFGKTADSHTEKTARAAAAGRILGALCGTHLTRKYY